MRNPPLFWADVELEEEEWWAMRCLRVGLVVWALLRMAAWLGGCCSGGVLVVAFWWRRRVWPKITIAKEKRLSEDRSPYKSHKFPLYNGIGLTTHELTEISHLGTSMM